MLPSGSTAALSVCTGEAKQGLLIRSTAVRMFIVNQNHLGWGMACWGNTAAVLEPPRARRSRRCTCVGITPVLQHIPRAKALLRSISPFLPPFLPCLTRGVGRCACARGQRRLVGSGCSVLPAMDGVYKPSPTGSAPPVHPLQHPTSHGVRLLLLAHSVPALLAPCTDSSLSSTFFNDFFPQLFYCSRFPPYRSSA